MKSNAPGHVNKIFLLIMATASFLLHGKKPWRNNARRGALANSELENEQNRFSLCYLIATNPTVASYYATMLSFNFRAQDLDVIQQHRIRNAKEAQEKAQFLLARDPEMSVTPDSWELARGDITIAAIVNELGTLRVQHMLDRLERFLRIIES